MENWGKCHKHTTTCNEQAMNVQRTGPTFGGQLVLVLFKTWIANFLFTSTRWRGWSSSWPHYRSLAGSWRCEWETYLHTGGLLPHLLICVLPLHNSRSTFLKSWLFFCGLSKISVIFSVFWVWLIEHPKIQCLLSFFLMLIIQVASTWGKSTVSGEAQIPILLTTDTWHPNIMVDLIWLTPYKNWVSTIFWENKAKWGQNPYGAVPNGNHVFPVGENRQATPAPIHPIWEPLPEDGICSAVPRKPWLIIDDLQSLHYNHLKSLYC
jgi:hypothetical protein